jgi:hypothetical protein
MSTEVRQTGSGERLTTVETSIAAARLGGDWAAMVQIHGAGGRTDAVRAIQLLKLSDMGTHPGSPGLSGPRRDGHHANNQSREVVIESTGSVLVEGTDPR